MGKSQGLTITLIIFIILTISLGLVCYFTAQVYKEVVLKTAAAGKVSSELATKTTAMNADITKVKAKIGYPALGTDQIIQAMSSDVNRTLTNTTQAPKTYREAVEMMGVTLDGKNRELLVYQTQNNKYRLVTDAEIKKSKTQQDTYVQQRSQTDTVFRDQNAKDAKRLEGMKTSLEDLEKQITRVDLETKKTNEAYRVQAADAKEVAREIAGLNVSLSAKLDSLNRLDTEIPDGSIVYVDQARRVLRLNVGKAEGIRVQTTFGIYPEKTLDVGRDAPKGTVEIVRILGDHMCEGRIVEDEIANPIMVGDLIYTPMWRAGHQVLFALTYNMDIDGDGKNDVEELKNMIEATGSKVAMWVDDKGEIQGELSPEVSAIITSDKPILDVLAQNKVLTAEEKTKIQNEHMKLLGEAEHNNIRRLTLADFLKKVHFREMAQIDRYKELDGVANVPMGNIPPRFSTTPIAPIYMPGKSDKPPVSAGPLAPIYTKTKQQKAPVSAGKVSDYYFRKK
ncbi:MAG: hypothetical protein Q4G59_02995 [Planctomycetia bacterium]|nr:hypothetical protein [Planctomycetia bacterium]